MPQLINRIPPGLLSLLDLKTMGQNPVLLGDELLAQIDLTELYVGAVATTRQGTTNAFAAPGLYPTATGYSFVAQPGELLVIEKVCIIPTANLAVGVTQRARIAVADSAGVMTYVSPAASGTAGERPAVAVDRNLVLGPGQTLQLWIEAAAGAATAWILSGNVASLRV